MEDIARAIGASRQWVYQQFESKEKLFHEVVSDALASMLAGAITALEAAGPLDELLLASFDAWCGQHIETFARSPHASEIMEAAGSIFDEEIHQTRDRYVGALGQAIERGGMSLPGTVEAMDIAFVLLTATDGLKKYCTSRDEYLTKIRVVIRVVLAGGVPAGE